MRRAQHFKHDVGAQRLKQRSLSAETAACSGVVSAHRAVQARGAPLGISILVVPVAQA